MHSALIPTHHPRGEKRQSLVASQVQRWKNYQRRGTVDALAARFVFLICAFALVFKCVRLGFSDNKSAALAPALDVSSKAADHASAEKQTIFSYNLKDSQTSPARSDAISNEEKLLVLMPLRNSEDVLELAFEHMKNFTYPHHLIDLAFLVSDCTDNTITKLESLVLEVQDLPDVAFRHVEIYKRDFGAVIGQGFSDRHGVKVQGVRRKLMGRARNWLLSLALKPDHSWVYWRDADILKSPDSIIEDLMSFDKDVIVPNVWRPLPKFLGGQQPYDLNSWVESKAARDLASTLDEDEIIVEGYAEYPTWRVHLAYLRKEDGSGEQREILDLDGIGGVSILSRANVFRAGANFPGFAFMNHAETEAFGLMCRKMGYKVAGLSQYTIWHQYEPSQDDLLQIEELKAKGLPYD